MSKHGKNDNANGSSADFGPEQADTFRRDFHAQFVLVNPPVNDSDSHRKDEI